MVWSVVASFLICLSLLSGLYAPVPASVYVLCLVSVVGSLLLVGFKPSQWQTRLTVLVVVCLLLALRGSQVQPPGEFDPANYPGTLKVAGEVLTPPRATENSIQVRLSNVMIEEESAEDWFGHIAITLPRYSHVAYGDWISLEGEIKPAAETEDEGYRQYLLNHHVFGTMYWPKILETKSGGGNWLVAGGITLQSKANNILLRTLPGDAGGFVSGVLLGANPELSAEFDDALKATGTTHIIVASGYNISVIAMIMLKTTNHISNYKRTMLVITMFACYLLVSGLDPSIIRACLMASLALIATLLGRQKHASHLLILAASIMLCINPLWVLDTSFQLSFLATLGIIMLQPAITNKLKTLPEWFSESISTTLSAQILVLPVVAATFGSVSVISLLTNVLILWATPILMLLGSVLIMGSFVSEIVSSATAFVIYPLFMYIKQIIMLSSQIPFATINLEASWVLVGAYYVVVLAIACMKLTGESQYAK